MIRVVNHKGKDMSKYADKQARKAHVSTLTATKRNRVRKPKDNNELRRERQSITSKRHKAGFGSCNPQAPNCVKF